MGAAAEELRSAWAACAPVALAPSVAELRTDPAVRAAVVGAGLWLRGEERTLERDRVLRKVPGLESFVLLPGDLLVPRGGRVPIARLPPAAWRPLGEILVPELPPAIAAAPAPERVAITLVRCSAPAEAVALLTSLAAWADWCETAPLVRLDRLAFAASRDGRVLVLGAPPPPIAGTLLWGERGILVPFGFRVDPPVDRDVLRAVLGLAAEELALLASDGSWERVRGEELEHASRSAVRLTARAVPS